MGKFLLIALAALVVLVVVGGGALMFWHIPAPTTRVVHAIPDARLPH
jgi:flagellar basal body-associated protein FliL